MGKKTILIVNFVQKLHIFDEVEKKVNCYEKEKKKNL